MSAALTQSEDTKVPTSEPTELDGSRQAAALEPSAMDDTS